MKGLILFSLLDKQEMTLMSQLVGLTKHERMHILTSLEQHMR